MSRWHHRRNFDDHDEDFWAIATGQPKEGVTASPLRQIRRRGGVS
jgi:hypothetical protein